MIERSINVISRGFELTLPGFKTRQVKETTLYGTLAIYARHVRVYKSSVIAAAALLPVMVVIQNGLIPLVYSRVIDRMSEPGAFTNSIGRWIGLFVCLHLTAFAGWRVINMLWANLEFRVIRDLEQHIFDWLLQQSHNFHTSNFAGSLVAQSKRFTGAYSNLASTLYHNVGTLVLRFIVAIAFLLVIAPPIAFILMAWTAIYVTSIINLTKRKTHLSVAAAAADSKLTGRLADVIGNAMVVRMFGNESQERKSYTSLSVDKYDIRRKDWLLSELISSWQTLLMIGLEVIVLYYSVTFVQNGTFTIGQLALVQFFLGPILLGLWEIARVVRQIETSLSEASEMTHILGATPEVKNPTLPASRRIIDGDIVFKDVRFTYGHASPASGNNLFDAFNLHIKPGEKIGLVGPSGSGKSTLTKLLLRFMDITAGQILVDGTDITTLEQSRLRKSMAFVPQEPLLFHRTIKENIAYGHPEASDKAITAAARQAKAHDFIAKLPEGYDTMVGERGTKLSGGERQRIAIARALLKNTPIVVWDEATSALDSESEKLVQEAFWELMGNRTAIVVAHRLSTIKKMDRILVLKDGQIAEQGTHRQLLKLDGLYAELWNHQAGHPAE